MAAYYNNNQIEKDIEEFIKTPAILVTKDDKPYEYKEREQTHHYTYYNRQNCKLSKNLINFLVSKNYDLKVLTKFKSGCFGNYAERDYSKNKG